MDPVGHGGINQIPNWNWLKLWVFNEVISNSAFFLIKFLLLVKLIEAHWRYLCACADSSYLSPQVIGLLPWKWWEADNLQETLLMSISYCLEPAEVITIKYIIRAWWLSG